MNNEQVKQIQLSGDALTGVWPQFVPQGLMSMPAQTVALGRNRPPARSCALRFGCYVDETKAVGLPASTNWREKAANSIAKMYLNDRYGDCVFAGKFHNLGIWSGNDSDSGGIILATDAEVKQQYFAYTGGRDNGAVISEVLDIFRSKGLVAGGKTYKIDGYASINWTKRDIVRAAIASLPGCSIGINLPAEWTSAAVWDVTNTSIVGGHDVSCIDYDDTGVYVASWARVYRITWPAFMSTRWLEEMFAMLAPSWYNSDKLAPNGIKVDDLKADLDKLSRGELPDVPDPDNPPPAPDTDWFV